jgi:hypothetical protein
MSTPPSDELTPALTAAEEELIARVEEACSLGPAAPGAEDTGELLRLEEALQSAARAAEKAIHLRQKQRDKQRRRESEDYSRGIREFRDRNGVEWRLWAVRPTGQPGPVGSLDRLRAEYRRGWLTFERLDGTERRRLPAFPEDWATRTVVDLENLLTSATLVPPRPGQNAGDAPSEGPAVQD